MIVKVQKIGRKVEILIALHVIPLVSRILCGHAENKNESLLDKTFRKPKSGARIIYDTNEKAIVIFPFLNPDGPQIWLSPIPSIPKANLLRR